MWDFASQRRGQNLLRMRCHSNNNLERKAIKTDDERSATDYFGACDDDFALDERLGALRLCFDDVGEEARPWTLREEDAFEEER